MAVRNIDTKKLQQVSVRLGDIALDPALWPEIIDSICSAVGATGGILIRVDGEVESLPHSASLEDACRKYLAEGWSKRDIRIPSSVSQFLHGASAVTDLDILPIEGIQRSAFYNEFLRPSGLQWFCGIGFRADTALWALSLQRSGKIGKFDTATKRALGQLSPRLTEVGSLSSLIGRSAIVDLTTAFERINKPAIAIDRLGRVLQTNDGAEAIFGEDITVKNARIFVKNPDTRAALELFLARLRATPDFLPMQTDALIVRRVSGQPIVIRPISIDGAAATPFIGARALLVLTDLGAHKILSSSELMRIFKLSAAEARLATKLATGALLDKAAEELGIARETARNQLKAIFAKTATHRQSELAALLEKLN